MPVLPKIAAIFPRCTTTDSRWRRNCVERGSPVARWMRLPNFSRKDRVEGPMAPEVSMATGCIIFLFICLFIIYLFLFICLFIYLFLFVCLFIYLIYLFIKLFYLFIHYYNISWWKGKLTTKISICYHFRLQKVIYEKYFLRIHQS